MARYKSHLKARRSHCNVSDLSCDATTFGTSCSMGRLFSAAPTGHLKVQRRTTNNSRSKWTRNRSRSRSAAVEFFGGHQIRSARSFQGQTARRVVLSTASPKNLAVLGRKGRFRHSGQPPSLHPPRCLPDTRSTPKKTKITFLGD